MNAMLANHIPQLVLLAGCLIYVIKTRRVEGYVMLAGKAGGTVCALIYIFSACWHPAFTGPSWTRPTLSAAGMICSMVFAVGFVWLAMRAVNPHNQAIEGTAR